MTLLGQAVVYLFQFLFLWLLVGTLLLPVLAFSLVTFIASGLLMARWRWVVLFGVLVNLVTSTIILIVPETTASLLHPAADVGHFGTLVILFAFALAALVSGIAATIESYHSLGPGILRWLGSLLWGLTGLAIGMIVVAVLVTANPPSAPVSTTTNGTPTVHMTGSHFSTNVVLVPKGEKLLLVDDDANEHLIQNGFWTQSGLPYPQEEPGAPVVHNLEIAGGSASIGPFTTAGVFHFYCTIHRGMSLTVVVQ
ncbi:MAG TPA: hypothetical protein VFV38_42535 [Ktedonobacteraceae bacterium]|nr:hypothetical protein [Ktedonobacteraceae bacterium]